MTEFEPTLTSLRETADRLDEIMEVSSPWVHAKLTPMLRDAVDAIEGLERENARLWDELDAAKHDLSVFSGEFVATNTENAKLQDENARLRSCLSDGADNARAIIGENAKLRELARLLLLGVDNDMPRDEELVWSQRVNALARELGIEVDG